jgi:hypothetical protein
MSGGDPHLLAARAGVRTLQPSPPRLGIELSAPYGGSRRGESWHGACSRRPAALYLRAFFRLLSSWVHREKSWRIRGVSPIPPPLASSLLHRSARSAGRLPTCLPTRRPSAPPVADHTSHLLHRHLFPRELHRPPLPPANTYGVLNGPGFTAGLGSHLCRPSARS